MTDELLEKHREKQALAPYEIGLMTVTVLGDIIDVLAPEGTEERARIVGRLRVANRKLTDHGVEAHVGLLSALVDYLETQPPKQ